MFSNINRMLLKLDGCYYLNGFNYLNSCNYKYEIKIRKYNVSFIYLLYLFSFILLHLYLFSIYYFNFVTYLLDLLIFIYLLFFYC